MLERLHSKPQRERKKMREWLLREGEKGK